MERDKVPIWDSPALNGDVIGELFSGDHIMLIRVLDLQDQGPYVAPVGYILPPYTIESGPGWLALEDTPSSPGLLSRGFADDGPIRKCRLPGSWSVKARYLVLSEAIVRLDRSLSSEWFGELKPGDEVLVLELGINDADDAGNKARFRMKVSTDAGLIGWISPQTWRGDLLLQPVDLLSPKVLDMVKMKTGDSGGFQQSLVEPAIRGTLKRTLTGTRQSWAKGQEIPWKPGGQYRVLETQKVRESAILASREVCRLSAGGLVQINELDSSAVEACLSAHVTLVGDKPGKGRSGWIRCSAAKDGHDMIDTRDQLQYEKVQAKLVEEQARAEEREREAAVRAQEEAERLERQRQEEIRQERERELEDLERQANVKAQEARRPPTIASCMPCLAGYLRRGAQGTEAQARLVKGRDELEA